ncbi:MAG: DEAD/DEAH box helicase [Bdellovibrionota bacterium]
MEITTEMEGAQISKVQGLNSDQHLALETLKSASNVFLTGAAGSGKSFLLRHFLRDKDPDLFPVLATTGAAAILVAGRTFHSFFGLGIMEGGAGATVDRALRNRRVVRRIKKTEAIIIDEISMLGGATLAAAEEIARRARGNTRPWGGMRIIAVGDFCQLPPVNAFGRNKEWAFKDPSWHRSEFRPAILRQIMRTTDTEFLNVLNLVRYGRVTAAVREFLDFRCRPIPKDFEGTRLFGRREEVERYNLERLSHLSTPLHDFKTDYRGDLKSIESFKKNAPIPENISLRKGALVMMRQNDVRGRWVNGSLGHITSIDTLRLGIRLLASQREIFLEKSDFTMLDADGSPIATASNFPVTLAYALTIHKAQGTTLDQMTVDLRRLWEPGQAYVALSRASSPAGLWIEGWNADSIFLDSAVLDFHRSLVASHN